MSAVEYFELLTSPGQHAPLVLLALTVACVLQDAEAYKAAQGCTLPDILKSPEGITDGWVKETGTMLAGCGRGVGVPTATQVKTSLGITYVVTYLNALN